VSPLSERSLAAVARVCAAFVVVFPALVVITLAIGTAVAVARGITSVGFWDGIIIGATTLGLAVVAATIGSAAGVASALFTVEIAPARLRQTVKALVGALHAVPAVGFGIAAAGALLLPTAAPSPLLTIALAALVLTVMIASVVFAQTRGELARVPAALRESAHAAGADGMAIALRAILPGMRASLAGIWWSSFALALGEATALSMIFGAASARAAPKASWAIDGTLASILLNAGSNGFGAQTLGLAPVALCLACVVLAAVLLGRRAMGTQWR
jgi:phosphate transport system permease protein